MLYVDQEDILLYIQSKFQGYVIAVALVRTFNFTSETKQRTMHNKRHVEVVDIHKLKYLDLGGTLNMRMSGFASSGCNSLKSKFLYILN